MHLFDDKKYPNLDIDDIEKRIDERRVVVEKKLAQINPDAIQMLKEHRKQILDRMKLHNPYAYEHMMEQKKKHYEHLKKKDPDVKIVAVEPATSPVLSKGEAGPHKIQGIGAGFVPDTLNTKIYDEVIAIENEDAFVEGRSFAKSEGILVGISSGAALKAAQILAARPENAGKTWAPSPRP